MEYEQLENGLSIIAKCIVSQDIDDYYELLSPDVVVVTHFPYPDLRDSNHPAVAPIAFLPHAFPADGRDDAPRPTTPLSLKKALLKEQAARWAVQSQRYAAHASRKDEGRFALRFSTSLPDAAAAATPAKEAAPTPAGAGAAGRRSTPFPPPPPTTGKDPAEGLREVAGVYFFFRQPPPPRWMVEGDLQDAAEVLRRQRRPSFGSGKDAGGGGGRAPAPASSSLPHPPAAHPLPPPASSFASPPARRRLPAVAAPAVSGPTREEIVARYGDYVDVCRGRLEACRRFCFLLNWIGRGRYLGEVEPQLEPRKGILQEAEILPAPPAPQSAQERYALVGRQHTNRNQRLSRLTLVWGRDHLRFCDQCYFDEGCIVTVHRRMLTLPELWTHLRRLPIAAGKPPTTGGRGGGHADGVAPGLRAAAIGLLHAEHHHLYSSTPTQLQQIERVRNTLRDFYGVSTGRVAAVNRAWPLLDYSFIALRSVEQLLDVEPVSGRPHVCRSFRPTGDPDLAQGVFLNADNDPTHPPAPTRTLIKAKNKRGDEEAYEFDFQDNRLNCFIGQASNLTTGRLKTSTIGRLSATNDSYPNLNPGTPGEGRKSVVQSHTVSNQRKYDANSVRISSCQLDEGVDRYLVPVLRALVANALLTINSLDLSCNQISRLPDFSLLPLQRLYLHANRIVDWAQVETRICPLPLLSNLTLHGNPIADHDSNYWRELLSKLLKHPNRVVKLRQLDFVTLSAQDYNLAGVHIHIN